MRKTFIIVLSALLVLLVAAGIYSYLSPQLTLKSIRDAGQARDTERLRDLIDFDSVKTGLKKDIKAKIDASAAEELKDNPFAEIGVALAGSIIDPIVDALVSPSAIARAISEGRIDASAVQISKGSGGPPTVAPPALPTSGSGTNGSGPSSGAPLPNIAKVEKGYEGYSRYRVAIHLTGAKPEDSLILSLRRESLFTWRLSRIVLPDSFFDEHKDQIMKAISELARCFWGATP